MADGIIVDARHRLVSSPSVGLRRLEAVRGQKDPSAALAAGVIFDRL
jgi:hypothetical protein